MGHDLSHASKALWFGALIVAFCVPVPANGEPLSVTRILIDKSERELTLYHEQKALKTYQVSLGRDPDGPKVRKGDGKTPEGKYSIDSKNGKSKFHRAFHVSYPNDADRKRAKLAGVAPGGDIMIHGMKNGLGWLGRLHRLIDWTEGCIAVTDSEMEELWQRVPVGTPVEIVP